MCVICWLSFQRLGLLAGCAFRIWSWICGRLLVFRSCLREQLFSGVSLCETFWILHFYVLKKLGVLTLLELWHSLFLRLPSELLDIWLNYHFSIHTPTSAFSLTFFLIWRHQTGKEVDTCMACCFQTSCHGSWSPGRLMHSHTKM